MARYVGGPFDGLEFRTKYDHLPVIKFPQPDSPISPPETVESYELRRGVRFHILSEPYPMPEVIP